MLLLFLFQLRPAYVEPVDLGARRFQSLIAFLYRRRVCRDARIIQVTLAVRGRVERAFSRGVETVSALLPVSNIDVVVRADRLVIPETGMGGYGPSADVVYLTIDPATPNLFTGFDPEFVATLGHELHHCVRHGGPGYGGTLGEALVTEGLACHFETELRGGAVPFYARALEDNALEALWARAKLELKNSSYDHDAWFFGSSAKGIPRHTGYSVGFSIVAQYVRSRGTSASRLWAEPAEAFYVGA